MVMKNKIQHIGALLLLSFCSSCNDAAFLRENPDTFYTTENIFGSSPEQINQVLTTCYIKVRNIYCPYNNGSELGLWSYSMGNGTDMFDVPTIRHDYRFNDYSIISSQYNVFNDVYSAFYYLIHTANTAIVAAEKSSIKWSSEAEKRSLLAQARFFRAFAYRNLGELFGGVPLVTDVVSEPRYDYVRSTRMETYQFAIDEFEAILNDLPETTGEAGRLVRAAGQHNLTQLYIDKGVLLEEGGSSGIEAYDIAVQYADDVIDGGKYRLMSERFGTRKNENPEFYYAQPASDYLYSKSGHAMNGNVFWDLFQPGNLDYQEGNTEAIWVVQSDYEVYKKDGQLACLAYPAIYGPVFRDQANAHATGILEDVGGNGMCQVTPTFYTRDEIYNGEWANDLRNSDAVFRRTILGNVKESEYFGRQIPWKVLYREENGKKNDAAATLLYPISCKIGPDRYIGVEDGEDRYRFFRDDYLIRLSETILLRAEAKLRLGNKSGAALDIQMLRDRAQCERKVTEADMNIDLILDERARELVYEESRWNTLLRMGKGIAVNRIKKYAYWDYPRTTLEKEYNVWPIPQKVIDINKDVPMEQNKEWK